MHWARAGVSSSLVSQTVPSPPAAIRIDRIGYRSDQNFASVIFVTHPCEPVSLRLGYQGTLARTKYADRRW
jgi:hypothetical protein